MWDADERAEIAVLADRLLARGDPFGEWLALRTRLEAELPASERAPLTRRVRALRAQLGSSLSLSDPRAEGERLRALRDGGLISDLWVSGATPGRLGELLSRPDAGFLLRLGVGARPRALRGCVELLASPSARTASLRRIEFELDDAPDTDASVIDQIRAGLRAELEARIPALAEQLPRLYELRVEGRPLALPVTLGELERPKATRPQLRTRLGRALTHDDPKLRRAACEGLRDHPELLAELQPVLLHQIEADDQPALRRALLELLTRGPDRAAVVALLSDRARKRGDRELSATLAKLR